MRNIESVKVLLHLAIFLAFWRSLILALNKTNYIISQLTIKMLTNSQLSV